MKPSGAKLSVLGILLLFFLLSVSVPTASGQWAFTYGGSDDDSLISIQQTQDSGYIVAGTTSSFGAGNGDIVLMKLTRAGELTWQKAYGGTGTEIAKSIRQTQDGGYIVAGQTSSFGAGDYNLWVMKLNSSGEVTWEKRYGGPRDDYAGSIQQTQDGGYIVAGHTFSFGEGITDAWVIKLDGTGNVTWQKTYGGSGEDGIDPVQQTQDGGYIVAGSTTSFGTEGFDVWIMKLDSSGAIVWQKAYGGSSDDWAKAIQQTQDGGYIVAAYTSSFGVGSGDAWVMKLNSSGAVVWQKAYGGAGDDLAKSIQQTQDGGYIVAGGTWPFVLGPDDAWILKLDSIGEVTWQKIYGGSAWDSASSIQQTQDGGYIVAGQTCSSPMCDTDRLTVLKLDPAGSIGSCALEGVSTAVVSTTSATIADTTAVIGNPSVTGVDTTAMITNSLASSKRWCTPGDLQKLKVGFTRKQKGGGTITSGEGFIDCPGTCESEYGKEVIVTLFPDPDPLSTFLGWKPSSLNCPATDPCQVTMDKNRSVKAVFHGPNKLKVVTTSKHQATGSVTSDDTLIHCPGDCEEPYKLDTEVILTATPGGNSRFVKWTGNPCKDEVTNRCTFTMNKNITVKAIFDRICEGTEEGLHAAYSNGREAFEGPINHGWGTSCPSDPPYGHNLYQGICTPLSELPVNWARGGWDGSSDPTGFSVSWDGYLFAAADGAYSFGGWVDGNVHIEINGEVVANLNTTGSSYGATVTLEGGRCVPVSMTFGTNGGSNNMVLNWRPPGASVSEPVPRTYLRHNTVP
jgi:hypothetical protein